MPSYIKVGENLINTDVMYSKTHEWVAVKESPARVGISDYAQRNLHDLVYAELPKVGSSFKKSSVLCILESIKAVAEVYAPLDCTVVEINSALTEKPELINKDPYGEGWLVKIKIDGGTESLMTPEAYANYIREL
ncbi:MAG: glycine cleavage system protein GcvH [Candidatus Methanomethylicaceae archaeon]